MSKPLHEEHKVNSIIGKYYVQCLYKPRGMHLSVPLYLCHDLHTISTERFTKYCKRDLYCECYPTRVDGPIIQFPYCKSVNHCTCVISCMHHHCRPAKDVWKCSCVSDCGGCPYGPKNCMPEFMPSFRHMHRFMLCLMTLKRRRRRLQAYLKSKEYDDYAIALSIRHRQRDADRFSKRWVALQVPTG